MSDDYGKTSLFSLDDIKSGEIALTIKEVIESLDASGYNAINQVVGYIISGDPGYITSRFDARLKITKIDRTELVNEILKGYLKEK